MLKSLSVFLRRDFIYGYPCRRHTAKNGYNAACSGDVWIRLLPGWKVAESTLTETNEIYRTPVMFPIIIYGQGVEAKVVEEMTPANVLAAEMARLLRIRRPNDNCLRIFR